MTTPHKIEHEICQMLKQRKTKNFLKMVATVEGHTVVLDASGNLNVNDGHLETIDALEVTRYIAERQIERVQCATHQN
jgi:hypothetical protein